MFALQPLVLLFLGVDAHCDITEDGLRTSSSHNRVLTRFFRYLITQVVELVMLVVIDDLLVGKGSLPLRIPVDHTQTAINQSFLVQVAEHLNDGFTARLVHGESGAVPVAGTTEFTKLLENDTSVFIGPVPCVFEELLARKVRFVDSLLFEAFDDLGLSSDRCMVRTRYPARVLAFETRT